MNRVGDLVKRVVDFVKFRPFSDHFYELPLWRQVLFVGALIGAVALTHLIW